MRIFLAGSAVVAVAALVVRFVLFAQPSLPVDRVSRFGSLSENVSHSIYAASRISSE